jgi:hypothetical protein
MMNSKLIRAGALIVLAGTIPAVELDAQGACINHAADSFVSCVQDSAWYMAPLCAARYAADGIGCAAQAI